MGVAIPQPIVEALAKWSEKKTAWERTKSMMKNPRVAALTFDISHGDDFTYEEAEPLVQEEPQFQLKVSDNTVRIEFKQHVHYADEITALKSITDYLRKWEFNIGLENGPECFRLTPRTIEILDRDPESPTAGLVRSGPMMDDPGPVRMSLSSKNAFRKYPSPPSDLSFDPDEPYVQAMYQWHMSYLRNPADRMLTSMAQFCLTVLARASGGRKNAAKEYGIKFKVLDRVGSLCANKGGRKAQGVAESLTDSERDFLRNTAKTMIRRAAEKAHDPDKTFPSTALSETPNRASRRPM